jgi:hypothetical protein
MAAASSPPVGVAALGLPTMRIETRVTASDDVYGVTVGNGFYPVMISEGMTINSFQCVRV